MGTDVRSIAKWTLGAGPNDGAHPALVVRPRSECGRRSQCDRRSEYPRCSAGRLPIVTDPVEHPTPPITSPPVTSSDRRIHLIAMPLALLGLAIGVLLMGGCFTDPGGTGGPVSTRRVMSLRPSANCLGPARHRGHRPVDLGSARHSGPS